MLMYVWANLACNVYLEPGSLFMTNFSENQIASCRQVRRHSFKYLARRLTEASGSKATRLRVQLQYTQHQAYGSRFVICPSLTLGNTESEPSAGRNRCIVFLSQLCRLEDPKQRKEKPFDLKFSYFCYMHCARSQRSLCMHELDVNEDSV
jgi:hypothetical protein